MENGNVSKIRQFMDAILQPLRAIWMILLVSQNKKDNERKGNLQNDRSEIWGDGATLGVEKIENLSEKPDKKEEGNRSLKGRGGKHKISERAVEILILIRSASEVSNIDFAHDPSRGYLDIFIIGITGIILFITAHK